MTDSGEISIKFVIDKDSNLSVKFGIPETKNTLELELLSIHIKNLFIGVNNDDTLDFTLDAFKKFTDDQKKPHLFDCLINQLSVEDENDEMELELGEGTPLIAPDQVFSQRRN